MSTITRERVAQYANDTRMCNVNDEIRQIARIALASLEADPVAWLWSNRKHPSEVTLVRPEDDEKAEAAQWSGWSYKALYAEPSAPVSVPDCFINAVSALESLYRNGQKQSWNERYTRDMAYASGALKACRAAMLQGADGNSPVIPDALIAAINRLLDSDGSRGCYSANRCHAAHEEVERLLAAAPQQEVKS